MRHKGVLTSASDVLVQHSRSGFLHIMVYKNVYIVTPSETPSANSRCDFGAADALNRVPTKSRHPDARLALPVKVSQNQSSSENCSGFTFGKCLFVSSRLYANWVDDIQPVQIAV